MDVKVIRLTSGEEVIAYAEKVADGWEIDLPGMLVPTENGVGIMGMMPYTKIQEQKTLIKESLVGFVTEAVDGLEKQYRQLNNDTPTIIAPEQKIIV